MAPKDVEHDQALRVEVALATRELEHVVEALTKLADANLDARLRVAEASLKQLTDPQTVAANLDALAAAVATKLATAAAAATKLAAVAAVEEHERISGTHPIIPAAPQAIVTVTKMPESDGPPVLNQWGIAVRWTWVPKALVVIKWCLIALGTGGGIVAALKAFLDALDGR